MTPLTTAQPSTAPQRANGATMAAPPPRLPAPALPWHGLDSMDPLAGPQAENSSFGLPADRQARMAARRAFVSLKLSFLYVVDGLEGKTELQSRVRRAEEPEDLWVLRAAVFAALAGDDPHTRSRRQLLNRSLETMFPTAAPRFN